MPHFSFTPRLSSAHTPIIFPFFAEETKKNLRKAFIHLSRAQKRAVRSVFQQKNLPKSGIIPVFCGDAPVIITFIGKRKGFNTRSAREAGENVAAIAKKHIFHNIAVTPGALAYKAELFDAYCEGVAFGTYEFTTFKGEKYAEAKKESGEKELQKITFLRSQNARRKKEIETITSGICFTKDIVNTPPSVATPSFVEQKVQQEIQSITGVEMKVVGEKELQELGAGGIVGVGKASNEESRFVVLQFLNGKKREKPIALIGKGVTYDTGGLSLKPARYMFGMKQDLAGAATVLGAFKILATLAVKKNIVAVLPLAENLVSRDAYKPDDVLTMINGKTVEVVNTDAEGRLLLADALAYAEKTFEPRAMVDLATLTGACAYAVGNDFTAGLCTHKKLFAGLQKASEKTAEPLWELPLHSKYEKALESPIADIVNSADKLKPGTIEGGLFLKNFVTEKTPWCHLDIASVAFDDAKQMATGREVRMLVEFCKEY